MGKSDENQTRKGAHKATDSESKHKNKTKTKSKIKHKNKPSVDATNFEATDHEALRRSQRSERFQQLREYKVRFGHCLVPYEYSAKPELGRWVSTQRRNYRLYREGKPSPMTEERIRELESIGFVWGTTKTDWSARFLQLCEYKVQSGHCIVPYKYSANPKLGRWVFRQRAQYKLFQEGKPSHMTAERIRELESIDFHWVCWKAGSKNHEIETKGLAAVLQLRLIDPSL